jgi:hypothetical protein
LTHALLNTSIVVDQTTASAPGEMMCDGVNGWRRSDCSGAAVEKTQITKMAPYESALMAPGAGAAMTEVTAGSELTNSACAASDTQIITRAS